MYNRTARKQAIFCKKHENDRFFAPKTRKKSTYFWKKVYILRNVLGIGGEFSVRKCSNHEFSLRDFTENVHKIFFSKVFVARKSVYGYSQRLFLATKIVVFSRNENFRKSDYICEHRLFLGVIFGVFFGKNEKVFVVICSLLTFGVS